MSRFIGIDPGKGGAIAILDGYGEIVTVEDMPVAARTVVGSVLTDIIDDALMVSGDVLNDAVDITAIVEQVHSMPKQGVASSFDFGKSYGIVLGVLAGARVHVEHVSPQRWKRAMRLPADKEACRLRAIDRWPGQSHLFKLKKHADRAEAALIALWWIESRS